MSSPVNHMATVIRELDWFCQYLEELLSAYFEEQEFSEIKAPSLLEDQSHYAKFINENGLGEPDRLVIMLAMVPYLKPHALDVFRVSNPITQSQFTEFGGMVGKAHQGFLPSAETAVFLLTRGQMAKRNEAMQVMTPDGPLMSSDVVSLGQGQTDEPWLSRPLVLNTSHLQRFLTGQTQSEDNYWLFPAKRIETRLEWDDLVVNDHVWKELELIRCWIEQEQHLMEGLQLSRVVKPGYRALFYGPPGTGKSLTACLLGKATGQEVYRVDLSNLVSKYIGETEKNLSRIFDYAERNRCILFFDEADAIFGKRTNTQSANDRFANQEVAYLLQRVEDFPGVIILASNLKSNMDEAFSRRFQSEVYFGTPDAAQREQLLTNIFSGPLPVGHELDLQSIARDYEFTGGSAINIYRYAAIRAVSTEQEVISRKYVLQGIRRELSKEGKTL